MKTDYFDRAAKIVLQQEGGYADITGDPGGRTKYGICERDFPSCNIQTLTQEEALAIYRREYWSREGIQRSCCDLMPWPLALAHFDTVVNIGNAKRRDGELAWAGVANENQWVWTGIANKILQRALGIGDDGLIGPTTIKAISVAILGDVIYNQMELRRQYYHTLADRNPLGFGQFLRGWLKRCDHIEVECRKESSYV